ASCRLPWEHRKVEKNRTACYGGWGIPEECIFPDKPASMWKMRGGGLFLWWEQGYVSGFPKTLAPRARRLLGGQIRTRRSQILE
ncbi:hypothetical protein O1451_23840, partial [Bacteroides fragilis]|uniref:hypothetical protein n=1 Tax=Bacteroides fragilis TaxID=817 RepID=UPI0022AAF460